MGLWIGLQYAIYPWLVVHSELSSFYYHQQSYPQKLDSHFKWVVLGDSQWISSFSKADIAQILNEDENQIYYAPRPSEQIEGVYLQLLDLERRGIRWDHVWVNVSAISLSQNDVVEAHRKLIPFSNTSSILIATVPSLRSFYWKGAIDGLIALATPIIPLYRWNSQFVSVWKPIPDLEEIPLNEKHIQRYWEKSPWDIWQERKKQNLWLRDHLQNSGGYWVWKKFPENEVDRRELLQRTGEELPLGLFSKPRPEALKVHQILYEMSQKKEFGLWYARLPFSPSLERKILPQAEQGFEALIRSWGREASVWDIRDCAYWEETDFADYTHLGREGKLKVMKNLPVFPLIPK